MSNQARLLGLFGLIPFVFCCLAATFDWLSSYQASMIFVQYSAVLLSFFGGIHWWDAINNKRVNHQLYVAMLPSIIGWLSLVLSHSPFALGALSLSYLAILMYDKYTLSLEKQEIMDYIQLRVILTTVVVICHGWMGIVR